MSNEERILSMLTDIGQRLDKLEAGQAGLKAEMNSRFDAVNADMKKILDFSLDAEEANEKRHKEIFKRLEEITLVTKNNTYDIAVMKNKAM